MTKKQKTMLVPMLSIGIPVIAILALGFKTYSESQQLSNVKNKAATVQQNNMDKERTTKALNNDNIAKLLTKQGIIGTNLISLQNNMTKRITDNMKIAYNAKSINDFKKLDSQSLSGDFINILTNYDDVYKEGSYSKNPQYKRQGIKDINIEYGKYNHYTHNVYAIVNIDYHRFKVFNQSWSGSAAAAPHDTYVIKCNLPNHFADIVKYNPAKK